MAAAMSVMFQGLTRMAPSPQRLRCACKLAQHQHTCMATQLLTFNLCTHIASAHGLLKAITCYSRSPHRRLWTLLHIYCPRLAQERLQSWQERGAA